MYQTSKRFHVLGKIDIRGMRCLIFIVCFVQLLVLVVIADTPSAMNEALILRMSVQEEYNRSTGNTESTAENESNTSSERSTRISPGLLLEFDSLRNKINLNYEAGLSFVNDDSSRNITILHQGSGHWEHQLSRYLTLTIQDTFSRSEDRILITDGQIEKVFNEREINNRNNGEAAISYQFGAQDRIGFGYRNSYEESKAGNAQNGTIHVGFLNVDTSFTPRMNINATTSITRAIYKKTETETKNIESSSDFTDYEGGVTINYSLSPIKTVYARYSLLGKDFDEAGLMDTTIPFWVHRGALGLKIALSPLSEFHAEGGYFMQDFINCTKGEGNAFDIGVRHNKKRENSAFNIGVSTRRKRYSIGFEGSSGFDQDYFSTDNMGSFKFHKLSGTLTYTLNENLQLSTIAGYNWENSMGTGTVNNWKDETQVSASLNYQMSPNLHIVTSGNYRWQKYWGDEYQTDKKDTVWLISEGISYMLRRWLTLTLERSLGIKNRCFYKGFIPAYFNHNPKSSHPRHLSEMDH